MKRLITLLIALSITACSAGSSLWGVPYTPTPRNSAPFNPVTQTSSPAPTGTPLPSDTPIPTDTFVPTATFTPEILPTQTLVHVTTPNPGDQPVMYYAQSGDSLSAVAARFSVDPAQITSPKNLPAYGLVDAGTLLIIPNRITGEVSSNTQLIPDTEIIFSHSATSFDIDFFVKNAGGFLSTYKQWITSSGWIPGTQVIDLIATQQLGQPAPAACPAGIRERLGLRHARQHLPRAVSHGLPDPG